MKYTIIIDQSKSLEWGLSLSEAAMFSFVYALPSWAEQIHVNGQTWYFGSRNKAISEMPLITDKPDTVYRLYKALQSKGLIEWQKFGDKDCLRLTDLGRTWNTINKDANPALGKKSEATRKKIRVKAEKNPTYNNTTDNATNDKIYSFTKVNEADVSNFENIEIIDSEHYDLNAQNTTPPVLRGTPPAGDKTNVYLMYEAYCQFMEQKGYPISKNATGNSYRMQPKDAKALKDWAQWAEGMPGAGSAVEDWTQFVQAAWATGDKWLKSNFTVSVLCSQKDRVMINANKAKQNELDIDAIINADPNEDPMAKYFR